MIDIFLGFGSNAKKSPKVCDLDEIEYTYVVGG